MSIFHSKVRAEDRVPLKQKVAYGLGGTVEGTAIWIPQGNLMPVFNIGLGINPVMLGVVLMLWRVWDAFADLLMGNISDNARTRWGRRRPFIVVGAILTGLTMPLIWWAPRGMEDWQTLAWLLVGGMIFYACFAVWAMPYYSLQLEMSPDYDERTNITSYRAFAQQIIGLVGGWIILGATLPIFGRLASGEPDLVNGMRYISIVLGLLTIVLGVLPGLFVKERYYQANVTRALQKQELWAGLKQTLKTRPFLWIMAIVVSKNFGFSIVGALGFYVNAYYVCRGDIVLAAKIQGVTTAVLFAPNLFAVPLCTWLANRFGKQFLLYLTVISGIIGSLSIYVFFTPEHPWLQIIPAILIGPISIGLWLVAPAMQADVVDYDELATGQRREGSFAAIFSWSLKASGAITSGLSGVVLAWTGFSVELSAMQPPHVLENLRLCYIWIPVVFLIFTCFAISRYDLTRSRMSDIRAELERRRGIV